MILIDAGPLVALVDADDQYPEKCVDCLKTLPEPLVTVWPPLVEAVYLPGDLPKAQEALWEMLARGAVQLMSLGLVDIPRIRELMTKYADRPMDLADAALVRVAEREGIRRIFTVDRNDFAAYRLHGRLGLSIVPQSVFKRLWACLPRAPLMPNVDAITTIVLSPNCVPDVVGECQNRRSRLCSGEGV